MKSNFYFVITNLKLNIKLFLHKILIRVRIYDIDSQGIVHNINYLKYIEEDRVEYRRQMGYKILLNGIFNDGLKVVIVRNEIDYLSFAYLDDLINVYTRRSWIKNTSFCFDSLTENDVNKKLICNAKGILVNLNKHNKPKIIPKKFRKEI